MRRKDMSPVSSTVADESDDATSAKDTSTSESRRKALTKAYPRFTISESEFLTSLQSHALSRFGFGMAPGPASEMEVDVSKYLYFSGKCTPVPVSELPKHLMDTRLVQAYLEKLERDVIESGGQLVELGRISQVLEFASSKYHWERDEELSHKRDEAIRVYGNWKKRLARERTTATKAKKPAAGKSLPSLDYMKFLEDARVRQVVEKSLSKGHPLRKSLMMPWLTWPWSSTTVVPKDSRPWRA